MIKQAICVIKNCYKSLIFNIRSPFIKVFLEFLSYDVIFIRGINNFQTSFYGYYDNNIFETKGKIWHEKKNYKSFSCYLQSLPGFVGVDVMLVLLCCPVKQNKNKL